MRIKGGSEDMTRKLVKYSIAGAGAFTKKLRKIVRFAFTIKAKYDRKDILLHLGSTRIFFRQLISRRPNTMSSGRTVLSAISGSRPPSLRANKREKIRLSMICEFNCRCAKDMARDHQEQ